MKRGQLLGCRVVCAIAVVFVLALGCAQAGVTKNVILMIGDGMGFAHVNAGSYYRTGAPGNLCFEPYYKCAVTTSLLNVDQYPFTDSAAAASAMATGHKVNWTAVSTSPDGVPYTTILEHAKAMGKRTGLVGTDPISRATPAAFGAHDLSRYNYQSMTDDLLNSSRPDVMMGGGATPTAGSDYVSLAQVNTAISLGYQVVYTQAQMDSISNSADKVLGLFAVMDLAFEVERPAGCTEPHLSEQTAKALALLENDPDGFFLMVEGAKIDYGSHNGNIPQITGEVLGFNDAVQVVLDWMRGRNDTLLIVTADHETGGLVIDHGNGKGNYVTGHFTSPLPLDHTSANVPLYALGSNVSILDDYIVDGVMDNTAIFHAMYRAFTGAPYEARPYVIYDQFGIGTGGEGNVYYAGGVFDGTFYTGQITNCAQQWADHQTNGTALLNHTPQHVPSDAIAKCSVPMNGFPGPGGWLYIGGGGTGLYRTSSWSSTDITKLSVPNGYLSESICTDGTYLYMTSGTSSQTHRVFKYSVNHSTGALTTVSGWPVSIGTSASTRLRGISYYNGKIYAVNHLGTGNQIYEIDTTTRAVATLGKVPVFGASADNAYQCVRYGNQLFIVGLDRRLHIYRLTGITWTLDSSIGLGLTDLYGIAVKGDGAMAKYAWVTHLPGKVAFVALAPWLSDPKGLTDPATWASNNGYPIHLAGAVVTAVNPSASPTGFWIENPARTVGAHVLWNGKMPSINRIVSLISGNGSKTASGERTLVASAVTPYECYEAKPLALANRAMGPAAGSAGLATDGLLVKVFGRVTGYDPGSGAFYIDDGSGVPSGVASPATGVKVLKADGTSMVNVPNYVQLVQTNSPCVAMVTGVVRLDLAGGIIARRIDARSDADIVIAPL